MTESNVISMEERRKKKEKEKELNAIMDRLTPFQFSVTEEAKGVKDDSKTRLD